MTLNTICSVGRVPLSMSTLDFLPLYVWHDHLPSEYVDFWQHTNAPSVPRLS